MRAILVPVLLFLGSSVISLAQLPNSVAGIQLGMTSAQVKAKMGHLIEVLQKPPMYPGEAYPSAFAEPLTDERKWLEDSRDGWSFEFVDDRLIYIQHENVWTPKDAPNYEQTKQDLLAKFGTPTFNNGEVFFWDWDSNGHLMPKRGPCDIETQGYGSLNVALGSPKGTAPICGLGIAAEIRTNGAVHDPVMTSLSIKLLNEKVFYAALLQQQKRLRAEQQKAVDQSKTRRAPM